MFEQSCNLDLSVDGSLRGILVVHISYKVRTCHKKLHVLKKSSSEVNPQPAPTRSARSTTRPDGEEHRLSGNVAEIMPAELMARYQCHDSFLTDSHEIESGYSNEMSGIHISCHPS